MYDYKEEKSKIFTEDGSVMFTSIRDTVRRVIKFSGAITMGMAISGQTGDCWVMMACVDRLVELGELLEVPRLSSAQSRVFVEAEY